MKNRCKHTLSSPLYRNTRTHTQLIMLRKKKKRTGYILNRHVWCTSTHWTWSLHLTKLNRFSDPPDIEIKIQKQFGFLTRHISLTHTHTHTHTDIHILDLILFDFFFQPIDAITKGVRQMREMLMQYLNPLDFNNKKKKRKAKYGFCSLSANEDDFPI